MPGRNAEANLLVMTPGTTGKQLQARYSSGLQHSRDTAARILKKPEDSTPGAGIKNTIDKSNHRGYKVGVHF